MELETEREGNRPRGGSGRTLWIFAALMMVGALLAWREGCTRSDAEDVDFPTALGDARFFPLADNAVASLPAGPVQRFVGRELYVRRAEGVEYPAARMLKAGLTDDGRYPVFYLHDGRVENPPSREVIDQGPWYFKLDAEAEKPGWATFLEVGPVRMD